MRLVFLSKREPQQRDLVEHPYGRFHWLPVELARSGHSVFQILVSHRGTPQAALERMGVRVLALDPRHSGLRRMLLSLDTEVCSFEPDWIIGCSDTWYGWLAARVARRTGARLAVDAYDNYESYMPWNLPVHCLWRRAVRHADLVTAAGPQLAALLDNNRRGLSPSRVLPMTADPDFRPRDKAEARRDLGLPSTAPLFGYYGSWGRERGTDLLIEVIPAVRHQRPDALFVVTGRPPSKVATLRGVISLGYVDDAQLPQMVAALDASCVVTAESPFGAYSYPAKLCEAMACGTSVVATGTSAVRWMLAGRPGWVVPPGNVRAFTHAVLEALEAGPQPYAPLPSWRALAVEFASMLEASAQRLVLPP
jgi:glycosyltransferase involved in cell wall biosynthesis